METIFLTSYELLTSIVLTLGALPTLAIFWAGYIWVSIKLAQLEKGVSVEYSFFSPYRTIIYNTTFTITFILSILVCWIAIQADLW